MQSSTYASEVARSIERRLANRHFAVLRVAKIKFDETATLCRIRDISRSGARIETNIPVAVDSVATIEIRSDLKAIGTVVWTSGNHLGLRFHFPVNIEVFLGRGNNRTDKIRARRPRFKSVARAAIEGLESDSYAVLRDISLEGASFELIESRRLLRIGEQMAVRIDGLPRKRASVKWVGVESFGIQFGNPIQYPELEHWLLRSGSCLDPKMQDFVKS